MTTTIEVPAGTNVLNVTQESNRILLEFVPKFKEGDFLYSDAYAQETILIFKKIYNNCLYYYACVENDDCLDFCELNYWDNINDFRLATEAEQQQLLSVMKENGKQWNAEKLRIEDIPQRKFKPGDKVELKDGMLDKRGESPYFMAEMDVFIGEVLTVGSYNSEGYIFLNEAEGWEFAEDWLELYSDEPIFGELAIFWDSRKEYSTVKLYTGHTIVGHCDHLGVSWANAIKFISKEQFIEHIKE